jgi:hypothetical protein
MSCHIKSSKWIIIAIFAAALCVLELANRFAHHDFGIQSPPVATMPSGPTIIDLVIEDGPTTTIIIHDDEPTTQTVAEDASTSQAEVIQVGDPASQVEIIQANDLESQAEVVQADTPDTPTLVFDDELTSAVAIIDTLTSDTALSISWMRPFNPELPMVWVSDDLTSIVMNIAMDNTDIQAQVIATAMEARRLEVEPMVLVQRLETAVAAHEESWIDRILDIMERLVGIATGIVAVYAAWRGIGHGKREQEPETS